MSWRQWFGTYNGRLFLQGSAIASSLAAFAGYHLPQTLLLDKYKDFVQSYEKGIGQPVPAKVKKLYEEVLEDLKVPGKERQLLDIFTVYGFDMFHAGSTVLRSGAIIGVPVNFSYETDRDVNRKIKIVTKSVNWESDTGERLRKSLVFSEDARRFALAREIHNTRGAAVWLFGIYPTAAILMTYTMSRTLNKRLSLRQHPFRFIMYSLVASFSIALYFMVTDLTSLYLEMDSDETAAALSPAYTKGGIEFYSKIKERNKALRELMGKEGEKLYSSSGNENVLFRRKTTPLSDRLLFLEKLAKNGNNINT